MCCSFLHPQIVRREGGLGGYEEQPGKSGSRPFRFNVGQVPRCPGGCVLGRLGCCLAAWVPCSSLPCPSYFFFVPAVHSTATITSDRTRQSKRHISNSCAIWFFSFRSAINQPPLAQPLLVDDLPMIRFRVNPYCGSLAVVELSS